MDNTYLLQSRRTEYLKKFQKTTTPLFIEGIYSIYNIVKKKNKFKRLLLKEFQQAMVDISRWSQDIIKNEHLRFKKQSSVVDKLIRAIFDLDIFLKKDLCKNAEDFIPCPWDFIHQCYLNIARALWKQPFLLYDVNIDKLTIQQNKLKIEKIVSLCIQDTFAQFLPLDIEHDDVSNIDYLLKKSNQDLVQNEIDSKDILETNIEFQDGYGDNNDIMTKDNNDLDAVKHYVSECNDNFKKLDYEINSNLHENLNVFQNERKEDEYVDDCDKKDNNTSKQLYETLETHDANSDILDEYIDVVRPNEIMDSNSDIIDDSHSDIQESMDDELLDQDTPESDNDEMSFTEEDTSNTEMYETRSFHSEDVSDIDSVNSKELYISHYDTQNSDNKHFEENNNDSKYSEVKNVTIRDKAQQYNSDETTQNIHINHDENQKDIKVINIDDTKSKISSKKEALLSIKKKVKSSMHHSRDKKNDKNYERYGDRIQVERKNMSFF